MTRKTVILPLWERIEMMRRRVQSLQTKDWGEDDFYRWREIQDLEYTIPLLEAEQQQHSKGI